MMELIIRVINLQEFPTNNGILIDLKQLTVLVLTLVLRVGKIPMNDSNTKYSESYTLLMSKQPIVLQF
jgi:hypothetical protein